MSLCLAPPGELGFLVDPIGPGTRALAASRPGTTSTSSARSATASTSTSSGRSSSAAGSASRRSRTSPSTLGGPPAVLGFRTAHHAEAAALVPNAEVVLEPALRHRGCSEPGYDVLACGPEPMLEAVRALAPRAQLAWEAPMACGYGACYGCAVEIDGRLRAALRRGPRPRRPRRVACHVRTVGGMILNASGCLDALTAPDVARCLDAFVTKTVTPLPREGNAPVRIAETDVGMLNSIGLANPGIDRFLADDLPRLLELGPPVWVSVGGFAADDYADLCARLDATDAAALELNLSCPNVAVARGRGHGDRDRGPRRHRASRSTRSSRPASRISPAVATAAAAAGADGLSLVNTIRGLALDPATLRPRLGTGAGGLSGPALRPVALAAVHAAYEATGLPIVGMGGVETGAHALELDRRRRLARRARHGALRRPRRARARRTELAAEAARRGFDDAPPRAASRTGRQRCQPGRSTTKSPKDGRSA